MPKKTENTKKTVGRPVKRTPKNDIEELKRKADEYFKKCDDRTKEVARDGDIVEIADPAPYTVEGLCVRLGVISRTFRQWVKLDTPFGEACKMIHQRVTDNRVSGALEGKQNASFARFLLTNEDPELYSEKVKIEASIDGEVHSIFDVVLGNAFAPEDKQ